jgi:hypothetical protein
LGEEYDEETIYTAKEQAETTGKFPVILEELGEITAQDGENYTEILQEFSRVRFTSHHIKQPSCINHEPIVLNTCDDKLDVTESIPQSPKLVVTDEMKARLTEIFNAATEQQFKELKTG